MRPFKSLRVKFILAFIALMMIPLIGMALNGYFLTRSALSEQALERSTYQVHLQAESITSGLHQAYGDALYLDALNSLRRLRDLRAAEASADEIALWREEAAQNLLVLSSVRPMYQGLRFVDSGGQEIVEVVSDGHTASISANLTSLAAEPYFRRAMLLEPGGVYVSPFAQASANQSRPFVHYALRLIDGVIVIDLHAGWLLRNLPTSPNQDTWALIDQDGNYLVHPERFTPTLNRTDTRPMLGVESGSFENEDSVFVFNAIYPSTADSDIYWVIYRETPKSMFYANVGEFYAMTILFIAGAVVLALMLALFASRQMLKPLLELENQAAAFGRGGPAPAMPQQLPADEIGALTRTFCEMAQELERKRGQEHRLIERLIGAQEEERKLVAYDLHDGLIQQLVGARFYLTNCRSHCLANSETGCEGVNQSIATLTDAIVEGRRIVEGLRPAVLDDLGLAAAIEELARAAAQAAHWELTLDIQRFSVEPEKTVSVTVFRIAQEALNNVRKHANARHVGLSMHNGNGIDLTIEDDGIGFEVGEGRGLGVTTMQERAALIHGTCEIISAPGHGTRVHVWVPLTPVLAREGTGRWTIG